MILSDRVSGKVPRWGILAALGLALVALPAWSWGHRQPPPAPEILPPTAGIVIDTSSSTSVENELPQQKDKPSVAEDALLRDLIEQGKFAEAKARLDALRKEQAAEKHAKGRPNLVDQLKKADADFSRAVAFFNRLTENPPLTTDELYSARANVEKARAQMELAIRRVEDELQEATAAKALREAEYKRLQQLFQQGEVSAAVLDAARAGVQAAGIRAQQLSDFLAVKQDQQEPKVPPKEQPASGQTQSPSPSTLDLAERYLKAKADLKKARSRMDLVKKAPGTQTQKDLIDGEIELERAEHYEKFLARHIKDAFKSAEAAMAAAEAGYDRAVALYKKGFLAMSQVDAARVRRDEIEAMVKQLQALVEMVSPPPAAPRLEK